MIWGTRTALNTPPATSRKIRLGRLFALMNVSLTVEPRPSAVPSIQVFPKPRKREMSVPAAMIALDRVSLAATAPGVLSAPAGSGGTPSGTASPDARALSEGKLEADIDFIVSPEH